MNERADFWETWVDEAARWWFDGEHETMVTVQPGDECRFGEVPGGGLILLEVRPRGLAN